MERMALEIRVVLQSVNAVTKYAHTSDFDIFETSQRSSLISYSHSHASVEEFDGQYGKSVLHSLSPNPSIRHAFHLSNLHWCITRRSLESLLLHSFGPSRSSFQSTGGLFSYHRHLVASEPKERTVFSEITQNRSNPA